MSHYLDATENRLLDELSSTVEMIRPNESQVWDEIRDGVESGQWSKACRWFNVLVQWLKEERIIGDAIVKN